MTSQSLYTHKESNIRKTWLLFTVFLVFIVAIGYVFSQVYGNPSILYGAFMFSLVLNFVGYFWSDSIALSMARATHVKSREDNPYLWNMVENLSITAGLPMPRLYITSENQINAFATGRDAKHAAIAVTRGSLERLENEELEGVLAHELSHIGNRDILISTVAVVLAGVISMASDFFLRSLIWGGRGRDSDDNRGGNGVMVLIGIAVAILAPISAMLMQLAISRKREFLADASGALLTRYPEGLARALEKIANDSSPMRAGAHDATAHLWIANPFKTKGLKGMHKLFLTHPPVEERIAALRGMKI